MSQSSISPELSAGPIPESERIASIDVLRGVAVLGILVMNIQSFAMIGAAYMNPTAYGSLEGVNWWVWYLGHLLADQKFWTIFSMLFGAGIVVMSARAGATGRSAIGIHYRRMAWLLLFGLMHAHLLWYGDILYFYALCGMVAYPLRRLPPWALIGLGLVAISIGYAISLGSGIAIRSGHIPAEVMQEAWNPPLDAVVRETVAYRGGWLEQMPHRVPSAIFFETFLFLFFIGWRTGGLILVGMALYKLGVFSAARSRAFYTVLVGLGALAVPVIMYGVRRNVEAGWDITYSFFHGTHYNLWASIFVALGWVGLVMLACKSGAIRPLTRPLADVGRMALTCYLMQTIICTTIFYGHGFGFFGKLERWQQLLIVLAVWAFLLVAAPLWLRYFRFGPFEWLWRSLTYWKVQPMRREAA